MSRTIRRGLTALIAAAGVLVADGACSERPADGSRPPAGQPTAGKRLRVAGIVLKWITADKERNYARVEPLVRQAAAQGAELIVTTECFLDGYAIRDKTIPIDQWHRLAEPIPDGQYVQRLRRLARELRVWMVAGMLERDGTSTFNTAVLIDPGGDLVGRYHKQRLDHEFVRNTPGHDNPVFATPFGKVGLMICADRRQPEIARQLRHNGAELIVCPSGGMWGPQKNDHYLQSRSRENGVPIVFVHPVEFLVTAADGAILDRRFVGQEMSLPPEKIGTEADGHLIAIYDLPLDGTGPASSLPAGAM
ncbi:MAG: carbon-nitrogen hydrolase family protein [Planctomycetes bacterium]|nr:carbon-nitrogen hydrolase family protein [Planctomycetota bacterium]